MKIKYTLSLLLVMIFLEAAGQTDLSFYHLGEQTPQSSMYNPVFFPDAKLYVSLPVLSGVSVNFSNSFNYNDIFDPVDGTDSIQFNPEKLLGRMKSGDRLSFDATISLLQVGARIGSAGAVQVFVNERVTSNFYYPKELMTYVLEGNGSFLGQEVTEKNLNGNGVHFREYGVGYSHQLQVLNGKRLRVGIKAKYLQGVFNAQVAKDATVALTTDADTYSLTVNTNNPVINTAGINYMDSVGYITGNGNTGFGVDLGVDLQINPKLSIAFAANDLGSISWSDGVENYVINSSETTFDGLDLQDLENAGDILGDTLKQLFDYDTNTEGYQSKLNARLILSGNYKVFPKGSVSGTILARDNMGQWGWTYGVGYTHQLGKILTMSATLSNKSNQGFAFGGGFAARLGFVQLYTSVDNMIGFADVRNMKDLNMRFGINFLFGRTTTVEVEAKEKRVKPEKQKISPFPDEYDLDHLEDLN